MRDSTGTDTNRPEAGRDGQELVDRHVNEPCPADLETTRVEASVERATARNRRRYPATEE